FQAEDGIRDKLVTGVQTCALPIFGFGFLLGRTPQAVSENFHGFWRNATWSFDTIRIVGVAMVGALFSSDAWNNVTFTAGEVRNRSEERRVGKECRYRWWTYGCEKM